MRVFPLTVPKKLSNVPDPPSHAEIGVLDYRGITVSVRLWVRFCEPWVRRFPRPRPAKAVDNLLGKEAQCSTGTPSRSQQTWPSTGALSLQAMHFLGHQCIHRPLRQPRLGATQPIRCPTPPRNSCPPPRFCHECRASPIQRHLAYHRP